MPSIPSSLHDRPVVAALVAAAPPLSAEQRATLSTLLGGAR